MSAVLRQGCDALGCAVSYLQAARVVEIRHVVELLGVQHAEILAAVVLFLMLQFTKFTAVLLLAFLIAVCLFYMWDNIFPEVSNNQYYAYPIHMQYQYQHQPFYPPQPQYQAEPQSAHTQTSHQGSRAGSVQEPLQPFIIPPAPITSPDPPSRDQRTSALLPPFSSSDVSITRPFHPSARKTTPTTSRGSSVRTSRQEISSPHPESTSEASHQRKNSAPSTQKTGLPPSRRHSSAKRSPELRRSSALLDAGTPTAHGFSAESQELSPSGSPKREHKQRSSQQDRKSLQNRAYGEADVRALRGHSSSIYEHRIRRLSDADPQSSRRQHHSSEDRRRQLSYPNEEHKPQKHRRNPSSKSQKKLRGIEDPFEYSRMEVHDHSRRARDGPTTSTSHRHTVTPVPSSRETSRKSKSKSGKTALVENSARSQDAQSLKNHSRKKIENKRGTVDLTNKIDGPKAKKSPNDASETSSEHEIRNIKINTCNCDDSSASEQEYISARSDSSSVVSKDTEGEKVPSNISYPYIVGVDEQASNTIFPQSPDIAEQAPGTAKSNDVQFNDDSIKQKSAATNLPPVEFKVRDYPYVVEVAGKEKRRSLVKGSEEQHSESDEALPSTRAKQHKLENKIRRHQDASINTDTPAKPYPHVVEIHKHKKRKSPARTSDSNASRNSPSASRQSADSSDNDNVGKPKSL